MLVGLHVKNLALIEEEEVAFADGLNILTGETGAGKSILLGSVNLALGAKADKSLIRSGADSALVELLFTVDQDRQKKKLQEFGIEPEEDGTILVKRKLYPSRSQCIIGGETVTTHQLRELSELLMDVYGQRENQRLLRHAAQLEVIDEYAGEKAAGLLEKLQAVYSRYGKLKKECGEKDLDPAARAREADLIQYEINEIESAAVKPGEDIRLEERYRTLSSFHKLNEAVQQAQGFLENAEESAQEQLGRAQRCLFKVQGVDGKLDEILGQLSELDGLLSDACRSLSDYADSLVYDPAEFAQLEERLNLVNHLKDKYGGSSRTLEEVEASLASRQRRMQELENYENLRIRRQKELAEYREQAEDLCGKLSLERRKAAEEFCRAMTKELMDLNFNQVDFRAELESRQELLSGNGWDDVTFYISMNPGEPVRPLDAIASGGELSRIMLALKTVFAGKDDIHTLIFDEIDSGISGQTAWKVARKLGRLSADHQILCITHLPQIAAMEERHFLIAKESQDGKTSTHIRELTEAESSEELGRMMGGERITKATLESAEEMKAMAREARQSDRQRGMDIT